MAMNPFLWRSVLAGLPVLGLVRQSGEGLLQGGGAALIFFSGSVIFLWVERIFPDEARRLGFFILLFTLGVVGVEYFSLHPLFLTSLTLLALPDFLRPRKNRRRLLEKSFLVAVYFWIFLTLHGAAVNLLGEWARIGFFRYPAGSYLLIGIASCFLPRAQAGKLPLARKRRRRQAK